MFKERLDKIEDEEEIYLRRLSGGLFSLQLIDYIIVDSCSSGSMQLALLWQPSQKTTKNHAMRAQSIA